MGEVTSDLVMSLCCYMSRGVLAVFVQDVFVDTSRYCKRKVTRILQRKHLTQMLQALLRRSVSKGQGCQKLNNKPGFCIYLFIFESVPLYYKVIRRVHSVLHARCVTPLAEEKQTYSVRL